MPLVATLLDWIDATSPYETEALREVPPRIIFCARGEHIPYGEGELVVDRALEGAYDPSARLIYLPQPWDAANLWDRSVLLHELVHFVQLESRLWDCINATEQEAYALQQRWLAGQGIAWEYDALLVFFRSRCPRDVHP
ncbi:hypothetical protein DDZ14_03255 [Maritimibacter sp. 55A14]|nr:hypothetical protein DDZ14_03255 [Maritimibacter sp. 55A14]